LHNFSGTNSFRLAAVEAAIYSLKPAIFFFLLIFQNNLYGQSWTTEQLNKANTAREIIYLNQAEKDAIMYINLARLYPQQFVTLELEKYLGTIEFGDYVEKSSYKKSLIRALNGAKPKAALKFDAALYENAKCFAKESGDAGTQGHVRKKCPKGNYSECCSYGMSTGKDIAMQLLIDHNVPDLGHRKICLDGSYSVIGACTHKHTKWATCAVLEFNF
jgi:hypothetical protein